VSDPTPISGMHLAADGSIGPTDRSYWVVEGRLAAGAYPGQPEPVPHGGEPLVLTQLLAAGIDVFVNLTEDHDPRSGDGFLTSYQPFLRGRAILDRHPIVDMDVPTDERMHEILGTIDAALAGGRNVYVHCWGGLGRTGTVIGCWMTHRGLATSVTAQATLDRLRLGDRGAGHRAAPQTGAQQAMMRRWGVGSVRHDPPTRRDAVVGCLLGGAIGDALGAGIEFHDLASIEHLYGPAGVTDFVPAYGHEAPLTDDTQMTLFTAEGLIEAAATGDDRVDSVWVAYQRWYHTQGGDLPADTAPDHGLLAVADLHARRAPGHTCCSAIDAGEPGTIGHAINDSKGCGGVMRAAPAGVVAVDDADAYRLGCDVAALTHSHRAGWAAAGALAVMVHGLLAGRSLPEAVDTALDLVDRAGDSPEVAHALRNAVALADANPDAAGIERLGAGWVAEEALAIAVCAALAAPDPDAALLLAVNHSGDSDSTGAIAGNLVGAAYGVDALRPDWRHRVELADEITALADRLAR